MSRIICILILQLLISPVIGQKLDFCGNMYRPHYYWEDIDGKNRFANKNQYGFDCNISVRWLKYAINFGYLRNSQNLTEKYKKTPPSWAIDIFDYKRRLNGITLSGLITLYQQGRYHIEFETGAVLYHVSETKFHAESPDGVTFDTTFIGKPLGPTFSLRQGLIFSMKVYKFVGIRFSQSIENKLTLFKIIPNTFAIERESRVMIGSRLGVYVEF